MSRTTIDGFDYVAGKQVSMSRDDWRRRFPASKYRRRVENGETFYSPIAHGQDDRPRIAAEAYANIPESRS